MMVPERQSMQFDLPSGTRLGGKYELLRKLATGGMAEIYLARTRSTADFEKLVVIKRILPTVVEDPNFVQMFLDEARLAAALRHPNIADVYEVGEDDGAPFFAMEFIHGQDVRSIRLAAHARKEPVPLAISLAIMYSTALALDYAHVLTGPDGRPLNVVHRDVSASNVLVSYEGAVKLIDFGIARASSRRHQTQVGTLKGKIPYMSPEQCRGERLDGRSDLFSLGVVMYELTTGRRPFVGETDFVIMDQIVHGVAPPPSQLVRGYPAELEAMVMRLLAHGPDERYPSAEALLHDLDPFIAQHGLFVTPKTMSKFMRMLFAKQVAGFEDPDLDEVTRAQRMVSTITSESQNSQQLTPLSSFPPVLRPSQVIEPGEPFARPTPPPGALAEARSQVYPASKPRRRGIIAGMLLGLVVLGGGGYAGLELMNRRAEDTAGETPAAVAAPAEPGPAPAEPASVRDRTVESRPEEQDDDAAKVPRVTDVVEVTDSQPPGGPKPGGEAKPAVTDPAPPAGAAVKKSKRRQPAANAASKEPPKDPAASTPPKDPPKPPKDPTWDKNDKDSPFLPN